MILATHTGINNFVDPTSNLSGCCNDARDWNTRIPGKLLLNTAATRQKWLDTIHKQRSMLRPGDWWVITRSSHGTYTKDRNGDEPDGRDEQFVFHDFELLSDDEFARILSNRPSNVPTLVLSDCCHGGSSHRFFPAPKSASKVRYLPPGMINPKTYAMALLRDRATAKPIPLPGVIHIGACADWDYAADAWFSNRANGAFTYYLLRCFDYAVKRRFTFRQLFERLKQQLPNQQYPQSPVCSASADMLDRQVRELAA